jgi:hypothetical protein
MLFINNPDAIRIIIEARHETNRHIPTITDVARTTRSKRPSAKTQIPHSRLAPLTAAN